MTTLRDYGSSVKPEDKNRMNHLVPDREPTSIDRRFLPLIEIKVDLVVKGF